MNNYSASGLVQTMQNVKDCLIILESITSTCEEFGNSTLVNTIRSEDSNLAASCMSIAETANSIKEKIIKLRELSSISLNEFINLTIENEKKAAVDTTKINDELSNINNELSSIDF